MSASMKTSTSCVARPAPRLRAAAGPLSRGRSTTITSSGPFSARSTAATACPSVGGASVAGITTVSVVILRVYEPPARERSDVRISREAVAYADWTGERCAVPLDRRCRLRRWRDRLRLHKSLRLLDRRRDPHRPLRRDPARRLCRRPLQDPESQLHL